MKPIYRRLLPLYAAAFLQSFVMWYAIEKLFMHHIGFNDAGIGVMVAIYAAVMLLTETPAGIWADRWSRKGVLMVGGVALVASSLIGGLSTEPVMYIFCAVLWGMFYALYTGMYDTIVYDVLVEETGSGDNFERVYGYVGVVESVALVASALLGGVIGQVFNLPAVYFFTIPMAVASVICLWFFKEPQLHKAHEPTTIAVHLRDMLGMMLKNKRLLWTAACIVLVLLLSEVVFEFSQLWLIALAVPGFLFGPGFAAVLTSTGTGSFIAGRIGKHRHAAMRIMLAIMALACLALVFERDALMIIAAQVVLAAGAIAMHVLYSRDMHDELPAKYRGGSASAVGTAENLLLVPMGLAFGWLSTQYGVFTAAWIGVGLVIVLAICELHPANTV